MNILKKKAAPGAEGHAVSAERLSAVVRRGRSETAYYPSPDLATPELVDRRFWTPEEIVVTAA